MKNLLEAAEDYTKQVGWRDRTHSRRKLFHQGTWPS